MPAPRSCSSKRAFEVPRHRAVRGLHQEEGARLPIAHQSQVVVARLGRPEDVDLAARHDLEPDVRVAKRVPQALAALRELVRHHTRVILTYVRSRDRGLHSVRGKGARERDALLHRRRAVVDAWEQMYVGIDHSATLCPAPGSACHARSGRTRRLLSQDRLARRRCPTQLRWVSFQEADFCARRAASQERRGGA